MNECEKHGPYGEWCPQCLEEALAKLRRENPEGWQAVMVIAAADEPE